MFYNLKDDWEAVTSKNISYQQLCLKYYYKYIPLAKMSPFLYKKINNYNKNMDNYLLLNIDYGPGILLNVKCIVSYNH